MRRLSCGPRRIEELFPPHDASWQASDVISAVEEARAALRVPFFIHGRNVGLPPPEEELARLERCMHSDGWVGLGERRYYFPGEAYFMRQLLNHSWRVDSPSKATILVVPGFPDFEAHCERGILTPHARIVAAIQRTSEFRTRPRDHLFVSLHWGTHPWARASSRERPQGSTSPSLVRAFMEARIADPLLQSGQPTRPESQWNSSRPDATDYLLVAPYVDNVGTGGWNASYSGHRLHWHHREATRDVDFFLGGQFTTSVGPGRFHMGYYPRWQLLQAWSADPSAFPRTVFVESDCPGSSHGCEGELMSMDSFLDERGVFRGAISGRVPHNWPAVRRCEVAPLNGSQLAHRSVASIHRLHASWGEGGASKYACVSACDPDELSVRTSGACHGRHDPGALLLRARFALCPRGDTPTSTRLYDAVATGAIPVLISDHVWSMGMPFQCLVPYQLLTVSVQESEIARAPAATLRKVAANTAGAMEERMRRLLRHFRRDLLWRAPDSRVAENVLLEAARAAATLQPDGRSAPCCPIFDRST